MSYDRPYRGGGGRRRYRDDDHERRRDFVESPQEKLKGVIIRLGEVDPYQEIPNVEKQIRALKPVVLSNLSEAFHIGVTEQPFKIPFYSSLLRMLHESRPDDEENAPSLGRQILDEFWKGFQAYLDKLAWRETRLCIQFFAHLTMAELVTRESMLALLQSFTAVLEEFGASQGRAKAAALCAAEGLMISGNVLYSQSQTTVDEIINSIQTYVDGTTSAKWLVQPMMRLHSATEPIESADEVLDTALSALKALQASDFLEEHTSHVHPYISYPDLDPSFNKFDLPSVLVPPEVIELDNLSTESGEDSQVKKEEWPEFHIRCFDNDITPDPCTPAGYAVRSALRSIIDIFEVNRKDCARLLLEYPKWTDQGTFKPRPGAPDCDPIEGRFWQLESTIIEVVLGIYLSLPEPNHRAVYYVSLITELCKLSPQTVGPAVGKSIRRLHSYLGDGLDFECASRFADWFSVHMSNFGFQWVWKEWVPDLSLPIQHPKRVFMRRAVEEEIRLAYFERIAKTLPEPMQEREGYVLPEEAPGPNFMYDDSSNPNYETAQGLLDLLRGRNTAETVLEHVESLRNSSEVSETTIRFITIQALLHIGSRSFSHLLNAIERYLPLLRAISGSSSGDDGERKTIGSTIAEARMDILSATAAFWKSNTQMVGIVFDKLMQYQIVDPGDVVDWVFENRDKEGVLGEGLDWELLKAAVDKANGRVLIARRKVTSVKKDEEDKRAREKASADGGAMEVDDAKPEETLPSTGEDSAVLTTSLKAFNSLTKEQKTTLSKALNGFVSSLNSSSSASVLTERAWHNRANWGKEEWNAWETWGCYRHYCRMYAPYLRNYTVTLGTVAFAPLEGSTEPAAVLIQKIWNIATGQEA